MKNLITLLLILIAANTFAQEPVGVLTGTVKDKKTKEPLIGVGIGLEGTPMGTVTDADGNFRIAGIPPKTYKIKIQSVDYKPANVYNVVITTGNVEVLDIELEPNAINLTEVVIRVKEFEKDAETPLSVYSLSAEEIKSNPGGNFDISRVIQAFPGVSGTSGSVGGYRNDLIIRGGGPNENVYYLDGIEVPVINHFATQGSAGGPTGIVNVSFIDEVNLYTSAFPAKYDNPLSGVLQMKQRAANPEKIQHNVRLSSSELAYTVDGPVNDKLSFLASARRSYLQLLFKALDLPILPSYWDFQYKVDYKINKKLSFYTLGIGAIDKFRFQTPEDLSAENVYILRSNPTINQWNYTNGYGLKGLMKNGYWHLTLSRNMLNNELDRFEDNQNPDENERILKIRSLEIENKARFEWNKYFDKWSYSAGVMVQYDKFNNNIYNRVRSEIRNANGVLLQPKVAVQDDVAIDFFRYGFFAQAAHTFFKERLNLSLGVRSDANTWLYNDNDLLSTLSPRIAASVTVTEKLKFNASYGQYYKLAPYTVLAYRERGTFLNKNTDYIKSTHYVAGFEYFPWQGARFTLEGFYKKYDNYPVSLRDSVSLANKGGDFNVLGNEPVASIGEGRSYGLEFQFQQKLTKRFYAVLSYTYYRSEFSNANGIFYPSAWDNRHLLSFIGGYKFKNNFEVGVKFRYQGGAPYTPFDSAASRLNYLSTGTGILDYGNYNTQRLEAFHAMDIRIDKKWNFTNWTLDLYLDIANVYGSGQPSYPQFTFQRTQDNNGFATTDGNAVNYDGSNAIPYVLQNSDGVILPTIGFIISF